MPTRTNRAGKTAWPATRATAIDAVLERLAQGLEHRPVELGELVEQQHAVMGKADLARTRPRPTADDRGGRRGVMRRAEGRPIDEGTALRQDACDRVDAGDLERLVGCQRREKAGQAARQHRLAGPGRAREQEVVAPRRGDLERAPASRLPAHVGQIWCRIR